MDKHEGDEVVMVVAEEVEANWKEGRTCEAREKWKGREGKGRETAGKERREDRKKGTHGLDLWVDDRVVKKGNGMEKGRETKGKSGNGRERTKFEEKVEGKRRKEQLMKEGKARK